MRYLPAQAYLGGLCCLLLLAPPASAQSPLPDEESAMIDLEDIAGTITRLEAAQADPGLSRIARATLGALYIETGQAQKAIDILEPITLDEDAPAPVLYNAWRAAALLGQGGKRMLWLRRATQLEPVSPAGRLMGLMMGQQGAYTEALSLLRPWARAFPDDSEVRIAAAAAALQLKRAPDAEELLADLPQSDPSVRLLWGKLLVQQGDPFGSLATLKALPQDLAPGLDLDRRRTMAEAYTMSGQAEQAITLLEGRVNNDPGIALQLSHALFQSGNVIQATAIIEPFAERIMAEQADVGGKLEASLALEYGQLLNTLGRQLDALPYLERSAHLDPDNKLVWQNLGQSLNAAGRREEARAAMTRFQEMTEGEVPPVAQQVALRADNADPTGRNLREALKKLGSDQSVEALQMARDEAELAPQDIRPKLVEAQILVTMERLDEALEVAGSTLQNHPESADAHYQKAVVHMARHETDKAEVGFRAALGLSADHLATLNDLAVLLMIQDRHDEARPLLERVLTINPRDRVAADNLQQIDSPI